METITTAVNETGRDRADEVTFRAIVGRLEDIPVGQGRAYVIGGRTIAVFRQRDGRVFATDNRCPHRGGPLAEGLVGDGKVICPLHAWKIDLASGRCLGEGEAVATHPVEVVGDDVVVTVVV